MPKGTPSEVNKKYRSEYRIWAQMKYRCGTPTSPDFKQYGGRGIFVCDLWKYSFEAFFNDIGERPSPRHSLERKKNDVGYEPGNVTWELPIVQQNNTRWNVFLEMDGRRQSVAEWMKEKGFTSTTLYNRVRRGWSVERALRTPVRNYPKKEKVKIS